MSYGDRPPTSDNSDIAELVREIWASDRFNEVVKRVLTARLMPAPTALEYGYAIAARDAADAAVSS